MSDKAPACPHCGCPAMFTKYPAPPPRVSPSVPNRREADGISIDRVASSFFRILCGLVIGIIILFLWIFVVPHTDDHKDDHKNFTPNQEVVKMPKIEVVDRDTKKPDNSISFSGWKVHWTG